MPSVFGCIPSGSRYGNGPNELVHRSRAGLPFLDNHYRGYQCIVLYSCSTIYIVEGGTLARKCNYFVFHSHIIHSSLSVSTHNTGVLIRWNGTVEWNTGMEQWNGGMSIRIMCNRHV